MLLTFLLGLSGCSGSTSADARVNDHPNEADEELHVLTIGTADSGGTMYPVGSAIASVLSGHDEQLKVNLSASNGSYTNVENIKNGQFDMGLVSGDVAFSAYQERTNFPVIRSNPCGRSGPVYSSLSTRMAPESSISPTFMNSPDTTLPSDQKDPPRSFPPAPLSRQPGSILPTLPLKNYSFSASVDSVLNGKLDAVHSFAGIPVHSLTDLASQTLPPGSTLTKNCKKFCSQPLHTRATVPAGTYPGQTETLKPSNQMPSAWTHPWTNSWSHTITKILDESREELISAHPSLSNLSDPNIYAASFLFRCIRELRNIIRNRGC